MVSFCTWPRGPIIKQGFGFSIIAIFDQQYYINHDYIIYIYTYTINIYIYIMCIILYLKKKKIYIYIYTSYINHNQLHHGLRDTTCHRIRQVNAQCYHPCIVQFIKTFQARVEGNFRWTEPRSPEPWFIMVFCQGKSSPAMAELNSG